MKILLCFGTRPEAIKMAPVIHQLKKQRLEFKVCVTGQHREMLYQMLDFFNIIPDYDLDLMKKDQGLNELGSVILQKVNEVLKKENPDLVLVHGDTTTSVFSALAAFHRGIKVGHVEAGLRTNNIKSPFPEEMNRQLTGRLASYHFAPTISAKENLLKENIAEENIIVTGNTVVDALNLGKKKIAALSSVEISASTGIPKEALEKFILVTGHRRENFGEGLDNICTAIDTISKKVSVIFPVHLNPKVQEKVKKRLEKNEYIHLIKPVSYPVMLWLIQNSEFIISDSGGVQEEAPSFGKKVLVTRKHSERLEGLKSDFAILVGSNHSKIIREVNYLLENNIKPNFSNPYGDGKASSRIISFLINHFG